LLPVIDTVGVDGPVSFIGGLVSPNDLGSTFGKLVEIIATEGDITWRRAVIREINTEKLIEFLVKITIDSELRDESSHTMIERIIECALLGWRWCQTDKTRALQTLKVLTSNDVQKVEL